MNDHDRQSGAAAIRGTGSGRGPPVEGRPHRQLPVRRRRGSGLKLSKSAPAYGKPARTGGARALTMAARSHKILSLSRYSVKATTRGDKED